MLKKPQIQTMLAATFAGACAMAVAFMPSAGQATLVSPDVWYEFSFDAVGVPAIGCTSATCLPSTGTPSTFAPTPPWEFVVPASGGTLTVTDAFAIGDVFDVFNSGVLLGSTSAPGADGSCGPDPSDPVVCLADPDVSSGVFALAAGPYSITITPTAVFSAGAAYFLWSATTTAVPEPGTVLLIGAGLMGLGLMRRRKAA